jgi:beta-fructofuranosidase
MYYTASAMGEPLDSRGVVGIAMSPDLLTWTPGPPVATPGLFAEIEVPQVFRFGNRWAMLFCTSKHASVGGRQATWNGTHYFLSDSPFGPFELAPEPILHADELGTNYAARAIFDPWLGDVLLAWRRFDDDGNFVGSLTDPLSLVLDPEAGRIWIANS